MHIYEALIFWRPLRGCVTLRHMVIPVETALTFRLCRIRLQQGFSTCRYYKTNSLRTILSCLF